MAYLKGAPTMSRQGRVIAATHHVLVAETREDREAALDDLWQLTGGGVPAMRPMGHPLNLTRAVLIADTLRRIASGRPGRRPRGG